MDDRLIMKELKMAINQAVDAYKEHEANYVEGINSAHGRVTLLFDTLLNGIEKLIEKHPKTEFISFGKSINSINILIDSLDMEAGGELAENLLGLYDYCNRELKRYLEVKDVEKLKEIQEIISSLSESWNSIDPKK